MAIVVDTCSLVMIAKNYLTLDKDGCLFTFLKDAFYRRELLLLDAIQVERDGYERIKKSGIWPEVRVYEDRQKNMITTKHHNKL